MFAWLQKPFSRNGGFFELFDTHSAKGVLAARALGQLLGAEPGAACHLEEIRSRSAEADRVARQMLHSVRRTFLTPFDRGDMASLMEMMDKAIKEILAAANAVELYQVRDFDPEMADLGSTILGSALLVAEAMRLLRDPEVNARRLHDLSEQLVRLDAEADEVHRSGIRKAYERNRDGAVMPFLVRRDLYGHLRKVTAAFERVAREIDELAF